MIGNYYYGTGRRKTSVARVFLKTGTGSLDLNATLASAGFAGFTSGRVGVAEGDLNVDASTLPSSVTGLVSKETGNLILSVASNQTLALAVTGFSRAGGRLR